MLVRIMTVFSKPRRTKDEYQSMQLKKAELGVPPAIDFWESTIREEDEEEECLHFHYDPSTVRWKIPETC